MHNLSQRMMNLKVSNNVLDIDQENIQMINVNFLHIVITDLQYTTLNLDSRVTVLEENGGGDGRNSVAELEVLVETLEGTALHLAGILLYISSPLMSCDSFSCSFV